MTWSLINEIGVDYACDPPSRGDQTLNYPTYASRARDGSYVIAEEMGVEKQVPFRFECRTLRVDASGHILYDSRAHGIRDGYGCLLDDGSDSGSIAMICRTSWELQLIAPNGSVRGSCTLSHVSKRLPRYVTPTPDGTLLVVFCNKSNQIDIAEVDTAGELLWFLPDTACPIGIVGSVELTPRDTLLVADPFRHVTVELDRAGQVLWQHGEAGCPARQLDRLSSPNSIRARADGGWLVADTRNHRVLQLDGSGTARQWPFPDGHLSDPMYAAPLGSGNVLVCDTGNARVIELAPDGSVVWQYGRGRVARRLLSYPRSVALLDDGYFLVADTAHDRVVLLDAQNGFRPWPVDIEPPLFWPRCVRQLASGNLLVADARNRRILEVSPAGTVLRSLTSVQLEGQSSLMDPHDVRQLHNGHLLVADSSQDLVVEIDWDGNVFRLFGATLDDELDDPHSAQELPDGSLIIADTGNHRILHLSADGQPLREFRALVQGQRLCKLHFPRYVEVNADGVMVIADTGNNRVLGADLAGNVHWELREVPDSPQPSLNQPRWAFCVGCDEVIVCDHFHHRLVHARWVPDTL